MKHPHAVLLTQLYADWSAGHLDAVTAVCSDAVTFQVSGKSPLAGKYTKATFASGLAGKQMELSRGTYSFEVHDILAGELHVSVLGMTKLVSQGKPVEIRTVHVWRFEGSKPLAWYVYPRDMYQYDDAWNGLV
jgi:ketosteroid isomerase-like protein